MENQASRCVVAVSPFDCRMWEWHDRLENHLTEETCRAEIESFARDGQLIAVLGRPLAGDPQFRFELIYGSRRLFVARHLNQPLLVEVRRMTDREATIAMDIENRQRKDLSPYARGVSYARWLRQGLFRNQEDIARTLRISPSQVSRLLKLAQLPRVVIDAFGNPSEICEGWGLEFAARLENSRERSQLLRTAQQFVACDSRPSAREIYSQLVTACAKVRTTVREEWHRDEDGTALFRVVHQQRATLVVLPVARVSASILESIRHTVADILAITPGLAG